MSKNPRHVKLIFCSRPAQTCHFPTDIISKSNITGLINSLKFRNLRHFCTLTCQFLYGLSLKKLSESSSRQITETMGLKVNKIGSPGWFSPG